MKRIISIVLLLLMICGVFSSCDTGANVSGSVSDTVSAEDDGEISYTLVSVEKPYTVSKDPSEHYPDLFGQQLTDGQKTPDVGVHYGDVRMVGYTDNIKITIDLGEDGRRISAVALRCLDMSIDGLKLAGSVKFSGSNDGKDWTSLDSDVFLHTGEGTVSTVRCEFDEVYDFRYIRASVFRNGGGFIFFDEMEVYADVDEKPSADKALLSYANWDYDTDAWKTLSSGEKISPEYYTNVAAGKQYKYENCTFDDRTPADTDLKTENLKAFLTDTARTGRRFGEDVWIGIKADEKFSVTVDLGGVTEDLFGFRAHLLGGGAFISLPAYVDVYGSEDGKEYALLGRIYSPVSADNHAFTLLTPEYVSARYVRFEFPEGEDHYWIEELEVLQKTDSPVYGFYPSVNYPAVTEEILWDSTEKDYTTRQNLILGVTQQVASEEYMGFNDAYFSPADFPVLTDGKKAENMYCYGGEWFYGKADSIDFFFDIGKLSSVDSMSISFLEQTAWGISRPKYMSVFLSEDGQNWYEIKEYARDPAEELNANATRLTVDFEFDTSYAARFVRFRVEGGMIFADEMEAFGTKAVTNATTRLSESGITPVKYYTDYSQSEYATNQNTSVKANEIRCAYGNGDEGTLLPYVAYIDEDGNIKDTFVDGFIYGVVGGFPSGGLAHTQNVKTDWDYIFNTVFDGVTGLDALEETVKTVKEALDIPDYKVYVYITITGINEHVTDFGDVDGDGVSEDLSTVEGRSKVINWYTDKCIAEFEKRGYEHIELDGFYWQLEAVTWEHDDSHIIKEAADIIDTKSVTNLLWVPYYSANRYYQGYELGFDLICMQPNYMFDLEKPLYRFDITAEKTKRMNMCVEIEHSYQAKSDPLFVRNYMLYLYYGAVYGYMDATHVYYDDVSNFAALALSDNPLCRMQYDATYEFAKGTLDITPDTRDKISLSAVKDTVLDGALGADGEFAMYTLVTPPDHGSVTLCSDGSLRYFPEKGFTGTVTFEYTYNNYLGESEPCTVEITVK